ncbi:MAG TPA: HAD family phosphatase [Patescibacteria group bacterium]|nr:HAD family phosphatase [Patescibacteria group bacterium]
MNRPFAVFDIDGTLIRWQLYHAVVGELAHQNHLSSDAERRINDARMTWKERKHENSFKDYERVLVQIYFEALQKVPYDAFETAVDTVFAEYKDQVYTYTRDLVRDLKKKGFVLLAISGSHEEIVKKLAEYYGFDDALGTRYLVQKGKFTGEEHGHIHKKHLALKELIAKHNLALKNSIAVGDSEGDITMLEAVEQPIAFNPTRQLFEHAKNKGWKIVIERKNVIYELEPENGKYVLAETD